MYKRQVENIRSAFKNPKFKSIDSTKNFKLKRAPFHIERIMAYTYHPAAGGGFIGEGGLEYEEIITPYFSISNLPEHRRIMPVMLEEITGQASGANELIITSETTNLADTTGKQYASLSIADIDFITVDYTALENIDPNFKG